MSVGDKAQAIMRIGSDQIIVCSMSLLLGQWIQELQAFLTSSINIIHTAMPLYLMHTLAHKTLIHQLDPSEDSIIVI